MTSWYYSGKSCCGEEDWKIGQDHKRLTVPGEEGELSHPEDNPVRKRSIDSSHHSPNLTAKEARLIQEVCPLLPADKLCEHIEHSQTEKLSCEEGCTIPLTNK